MNAQVTKAPPKTSQWTKKMDDIVLHNEDVNAIRHKLAKLGYKGFSDKTLVNRKIRLSRQHKTKEVKKARTREQMLNVWSSDDDGLMALAESAKEAVETFKDSGRSKSAIEQRFYIIKKRGLKAAQAPAEKRVYVKRSDEEKANDKPRYNTKAPSYHRNSWSDEAEAILLKHTNADAAREELFEKTSIKYNINAIIKRADRLHHKIRRTKTGRQKPWTDPEDKIIIESIDNDEALVSLKKIGINHRTIHLIENRMGKIGGYKKRQAWKLTKDNPEENKPPFTAPVDFLHDHRTIPVPALDPKIKALADNIIEPRPLWPDKHQTESFEPKKESIVREAVELPCDYMNGADSIITGTDMILEFSLNGKKKQMIQIPFIVAKHLSIVMRHDINNFELKTKHTFADMEDVANYLNKK